MKLVSTAVLAMFVAIASLAPAQNMRAGGQVFTPDSSIQRSTDVGKRAHTNVHVFVPNEPFQNAQPFGPPFGPYGYETPASLACIYHLAAAVTGCNPNTATKNPTGGSKMIAIVDAYDAPNAAADLATFSTQFGLPAANFQKVYATGVKPPYNAGWEVEESLDVQWAHAMAPGAKIVLVEAASNSFNDLLAAEDVASTMVSAAGGGEVSNSWGGLEFSAETTILFDGHFVKANVVFFASSGDAPGVFWPGSSPNVVSAGGTTIRRNPSTFNFLQEWSWDYGSGGVSQYEPRPSYQNGISAIVGSKRGVPDLSFDSNPITGVWVLVSGQGGWYIVGGTSVASPSLAGIINSAGSFAASSNAELTTIYSNMTNTTDYHDLTLGDCGLYSGLKPVAGWDPCTGVGSAKGKLGK